MTLFSDPRQYNQPPPVAMPSMSIPQRWLNTDAVVYRASRSSDSHKNEKKAVSVPTSSTSIKRTTANLNNIIVTHTSAALAPKAKPKSKALKSEAFVDNEPVIEMQDEDGLQEEEAALASPLKGSESRKMSKVLCFLPSLVVEY